MEIMESGVPPGFRFHPTEEELVGYYLKRKMNSQNIDLDVIVDIDLYKMEPWDIQGSCRHGYEEQKEWYFFSHKDRKYPTGTRTNRATSAGFWKATGRDKAVLSKNTVIGMRKTLVFYNGRAPNGRKTEWIMHEYRLQSSELAPPQEEGWVVCRAFKKPIPIHNQPIGPWNHHHHHHHHQHHQQQPYYLKNSTQNTRSPSVSEIVTSTDVFSTFQQPESDFTFNNSTCPDINQLVDLPNLDSPTLSTSKNMRSDQWNVLDNLLLSSEVAETTPSPCPSFQSHCGYGSYFLDFD